MRHLLPALLLLSTPMLARAQEPSTAAALEAPAPLAAPARVSPAELPERLPTVFTAEIISTRTKAPAPGARLLVTEVELALRTCVRGDCPARTIVEVPGGRYGDIEQWVEDLPPPREGAVVAVTLPRPRVMEAGASSPVPRFARLLELTPPRGRGAPQKLPATRLPRPGLEGSIPTPEAPGTPAPGR